jgi:hypothetical protein
MSCRTARLSAWITSLRGAQVGDFEVATGGGIWVATGGKYSDFCDTTRPRGTSLEVVGSARSRTRTGTESPPRDFRTRYSFRCWDLRPIWSLDFLFAVVQVPCNTER